MFRILLFLGSIVLVLGQDWQSYVDDQLIAGGLPKAAIIGHDGSLWAISDGFSLKKGEGRALASLYKNPADVFVKGITIAGIKYSAVKVDEESIYGKKGAGGIITVKTEQAILIAVYDHNKRSGDAAAIVEKLGDYLRGNGY